MRPVLLADFGSTYTKVTAVDLEARRILGCAASFTTVETDINDGLKHAVEMLNQQLPEPVTFDEMYACSSAAGGLKMIAIGLVPELTVKAAREATLGAGAKILKTYAFQITRADVAEINALEPDIILLSGGTDGGNSETLLHNAKRLNDLTVKAPIILAGNRCCADDAADLMPDQQVHICENVMPRLETLNILPTQGMIRSIFLDKIVQGKGLSKTSRLVSDIIMPTPAAMLAAMELLADGIGSESGIGELIAVDLGGATTDVYSIAEGRPENLRTVYKGLQEPYAKRTVEGDIGMRYSMHGIVEAVGMKRVSALAELSEARVTELMDYLDAHKESTPDTEEDKDLEKLDFALASLAVEIAVKRHAGTIEQVYTPMGETYLQSGKDLRRVGKVLATGGALVHAANPKEITKGALYSIDAPESLRPEKAEIIIDKKYILAAMGLLSKKYPEIALEIMKMEIK